MSEKENTDIVEQKTIRQEINDIIFHLQDAIPDINRMDKIGNILGASRVNTILRTAKNVMIPALEEKLNVMVDEIKKDGDIYFTPPEYIESENTTEEKTFKQELNHLISILTHASIDAHAFDMEGSGSSLVRIKHALHELKSVLIPPMSKRVIEFKKATKARNHNVSPASLKNLKPPVKKEHDIE
jgi:hypothetical protein